MIVFSDGAWEPGASKPEGAGLVLIDPVSELPNIHTSSPVGLVGGKW